MSQPEGGGGVFTLGGASPGAWVVALEYWCTGVLVHCRGRNS